MSNLCCHINPVTICCYCGQPICQDCMSSGRHTRKTDYSDDQFHWKDGRPKDRGYYQRHKRTLSIPDCCSPWKTQLHKVEGRI